MSQLFVNNVKVNSSNMVSGNGVIHGLSQVLSIVRNRCDETKYSKFRVMTDPQQNLRTSDGPSDLCWNQDPTLFLHRVPVWTACSPGINCAPTTPFQT